MNIEALAVEAGFQLNEFGDIGDGYWSFEECAQKFAALVRAHAIEEAARLIDETWLASPGEYTEAIRALVKPPAG